jgi:hypothetical protein
MSVDLVDVFGPPAVALTVLILGWLAVRSINVGRPSSPIQRKMMWYGPTLVLGVGYLWCVKTLFPYMTKTWR